MSKTIQKWGRPNTLSIVLVFPTMFLQQLTAFVTFFQSILWEAISYTGTYGVSTRWLPALKVKRSLQIPKSHYSYVPYQNVPRIASPLLKCKVKIKINKLIFVHLIHCMTCWHHYIDYYDLLFSLLASPSGK